MPSLQDLLAQQSPSNESRKSNDISTLTRLTKILAPILGVDSEAIQVDAPLSDLGATSLDIIELAVRIEMEFKIHTEETFFHEEPLSTTLNEVATLIDARQLPQTGDDSAN